MINKSHWLIKKPTLFSMLCPLAVLLLIIYFIYLLIFQNGGELAGLFCLIAILIVVAIFAFDRIFAKHFNNKTVSIIELIVGICFFTFSSYNSREVIIDLSNCDNSYMVIIDSPKGITIKDFKNTGIFNKKFTVSNTDHLLINEASLDGFDISYKNSKWNIMEIVDRQKPYYNSNCTIVSNASIHFSRKKIDSIINSKLALYSK